MFRRLGPLAESLAVVATAVLTGIACCGPILIQWLGLLVWTIGGRFLLLWLVRYEIPVLGFIAAAALASRALARERPIRWANALLAGVALLFVLMRLTWEVRRGIVMAVGPVLTLFSYRQSVLLAAGGLVLAVRLALLVLAVWRRAGVGRTPSSCVPSSVGQQKNG